MSSFAITGSEHGVTVVRSGSQPAQSIKLKPAEVEKATNVIGMALQMETLEIVPSHITNSPFVIRFFENDKLAIERTDTTGSVSFSWDEGDELINALQNGLKIAINAKVNKHNRLKPLHRTN